MYILYSYCTHIEPFLRAFREYASGLVSKWQEEDDIGYDLALTP